MSLFRQVEKMLTENSAARILRSYQNTWLQKEGTLCRHATGHVVVPSIPVYTVPELNRFRASLLPGIAIGGSEFRNMKEVVIFGLIHLEEVIGKQTFRREIHLDDPDMFNIQLTDGSNISE